MARKKTAEAALPAWEPPDFDKPSTSAMMIEKAFGKGVVVNGQDVYDRDRRVVSISPSVDAGLNGGIVDGTLSTLTGPPGCGKTTLALHIAAKWQAMGRRTFYIAAESRIYRMNLGVFNLDPKKLEILGSIPGRIMTAEDYLQMAETILHNEKDSLTIVDSFSILSDSAEMNLDNYRETPQLGGSQRLVGRWCRKNAAVMPINNNSVIGIAHQYTNMTPGPGAKWKESLAEKVKFARSMGLACTQVKPLTKSKSKSKAKDKDDESGRPWGQNVEWKVTRSALGGQGSKLWSCLRYGHGIDEEFELLQIAKELGMVEQGGAYFYLNFLAEGDEDPPSVKGMDGFRAFVKDEPEKSAALLDRVRAMTVGTTEDDDDEDS